MRPALAAAILGFLVSRLGQGGETYVSLLRGSPGGDGSQGKPFQEITDALAANKVDILVEPTPPGMSYKAVNIQASNVRIRSDCGPGVTSIDSVVVAASCKGVKIEGFRLLGVKDSQTKAPASAGIYLSAASSAEIRNCIFADLPCPGVFLERTSVGPSFGWIQNCVIYNCVSGGIRLNYYNDGRGNYYCSSAYVVNSIITNNGAAVAFTDCGLNRAFSVVLDYCYLGGNAAVTNCTDHQQKGWLVVRNEVTGQPDFVSPDLGCFELGGQTSLRHQGHPSVAYQNPDGTRNDLGAFGGPNAKPYATRPHIGAEIVEVRVDPVTPVGGEKVQVKVTVRGIQ